MYHSVLRSGAQRQLKKIGQADLVIGLPTYKNPENAACVTKIALAGAQEYYGGLRTVLVNADAGRSAQTRQAVRQQQPADWPAGRVVSGRYEGALGHGNAVAALLDAALALDAKAIIILDSDTQTIAPAWIKGLAHLIFENKADLVLPRYQWSPLSPESPFSDLIVYPLFRALWGRSVRHPAAPDFSLSPQLAAALLDEDVWQTEVAAYGLPPWLATYAVLGRWRVVQSALGEKRTVPLGPPTERHRLVKLTGTDLFRVQFQDVLSVMLRQIYQGRAQWKEVDKFYSLSTLTEFVTETESTPVRERELAPLLDELALGWMEYRLLWQAILTSENLTQLEALAALPLDRFYFPSDLWARILYDFAVVFNKGDLDPVQVVNALFPIYQGRLAAYWQEIAGLSLVGREGTIAAQAVELEENRAYLKIRWHTYQPWLHNGKT
ncbi:MAG: hypothetical protein KDF65_05760 [Anaerolineae bacterium]|nr:hypothetical protein [Anaerolineae bacterium]